MKSHLSTRSFVLTALALFVAVCRREGAQLVVGKTSQATGKTA